MTELFRNTLGPAAWTIIALVPPATPEQQPEVGPPPADLGGDVTDGMTH